MAKCIIFSRVSTEQQSTDEQTARLQALAYRHGYQDSQQILIEYKESGIRLKEEERLGLTDMKQMIESDPDINCVFAFEISRIARTKKVLFSIEEFLIEHKVQLVIEEQNIRLLNDDGSINDNAEFAFTIYAQFAESEMRLKQERFKNGRERSKKLGRWHGGRCLLGFKVVDKKLVPDESVAYIIRRVFELYAAGTSQFYCAEYLREFGIDRKGYNLSTMLRNPKYVELVGQSLWNAVQATRKANKRFPSYRIHSPGEKLIKCKECGRHYVHITNCYLCLGRTKEYKDCEHGFSISDRYVDAFLLMFAKYSYASHARFDTETEIARLEAILDELPGKISIQNEQRRKLEKKKERIISVYTDGTIDRRSFEVRMKDAERQIAKVEETANQLMIEQNSVRTQLQSIKEGKRTLDTTLDTVKTASKREIYDMIHKEVKEVLAYREGKYKRLDFIMKSGDINYVRFSGQGISFLCEYEMAGEWVKFNELGRR